MLINEFEKLSLRKFKMKSILPDATILILGRRRSGKCLGKGTPVLMYDGSIKKVEDIEVGEQVMGDDSTPRNVLGINDGIDTLYKVTHKNGDNYIVNSEHILSLKFISQKHIIDDTVNSKLIVCWFDKENVRIKTQEYIYSDDTKDTIYNDALKVYKTIQEDRYIDISISDYLELPDYYQQNLHGYKVAVDFQERELDIDPQSAGNDFAIDDETFNIPNEYKYNSRNNRCELLDGIINTIGIYNYHANCYEITQSMKYMGLINDINFVANSLGFDCKKEIVNLEAIEFVKLSIYDGMYKQLASQIKIEKLGVGKYYGFEVDGNHRFVLGNFIVTHNSWLVRDIFYHHRNIPSGVVFSGTEEASPFFGDFIPDCFIHSEYDPALIESILIKQKRKIRESKLSGKSETGKLPSNNLFIVLDDMLHDAQNWKKEKTIKSIFFNGRHYNILFILTMQYPLGITPELRSNIDYVFIFNEPSIKNRKKIYEDYAGQIPSLDHFCNILDSCTQNHECLVIKTSSNSTDLKDQIFWYKAEPHDKFQSGHPVFWKYHNLHYNIKYEEEADLDMEETEKLKRKFAKTRKLKVIVSRQGDIVGYKPLSE